MHPAVVLLHAAGLPDGVGEGTQASPVWGDRALYSMPQRLEHGAYRNMPYILPRSYLSF
jgi:hypothetical protein